MNCLEAQSKIIAYIEDGLEDQELKSFILHVQSCKDCMDELELQYILIVGTKQIDEGGNVTSDFLKELHGKLHSQLKKVRRKELFFKELTCAIIAIFLVIVVWQLFDLIIADPSSQVTDAQKNDYLIERMEPYMYYDDSNQTLLDPSILAHNNESQK